MWSVNTCTSYRGVFAYVIRVSLAFSNSRRTTRVTSYKSTSRSLTVRSFALEWAIRIRGHEAGARIAEEEE